MSATRFASPASLPFPRSVAFLASVSQRVRSALALVALTVLPVATGCGVVDAAADGLDDASKAAGVHDVSGSMPLRWTTPDGQSGPVHFVFAQDGLAVDGTVVFENHPCLHELTVDAHAKITGVAGDLVLDDFRLPFELTIFDSSGPKKPDGIVSGVQTFACLAENGSVQLESL